MLRRELRELGLTVLCTVLLMLTVQTSFLFPRERPGLLTSPVELTLASDGPMLEPLYTNRSVDLAPAAGPVQISLVLYVSANDSDGVDCVIGSFCNVSETEWHNITMVHSPTEEFPELYSGHATNFTLGPGHAGAEWYYKFYACDSQGHWSVSGVQYVSFTWCPQTTAASETLSQDLLVLMSITVVAVMAMVLMLFYRTRALQLENLAV